MGLTRQELILEFMKSLAGAGNVQFNRQSIDNTYILAAALADKYLESL